MLKDDDLSKFFNSLDKLSLRLDKHRQFLNQLADETGKEEYGMLVKISDDTIKRLGVFISYMQSDLAYVVGDDVALREIKELQGLIAEIGHLSYELNLPEEYKKGLKKDELRKLYTAVDD